MVFMSRPNKFMDATALEEWAESYAPHHFSAWELSDACEYLDFWEWLGLNHPSALGDFEKWFWENLGVGSGD